MQDFETFIDSQYLSAQHAAYIVLSMPLNTSARKCIFINTSAIDDQTFLLKKPKDIEHELNDSKNIACVSIIGHYV